MSRLQVIFPIPATNFAETKEQTFKMHVASNTAQRHTASPYDLVAHPSPSSARLKKSAVKKGALYRRNEKGDAVKVTTRVRVTKVQKKLYKV